MNKPFRWRKGKRYDGKMRLPETYELRSGGELVATVQALPDGRYFWYGGGYNTASNPITLEEAKRDARYCLGRARAK